LQRGRHAVVDRRLPPDELHDLDGEEAEPEGEEQFGDVAEAVRLADAEPLDQRADDADQERREEERDPERGRAPDLIREIRPEHEEARMREVEHRHHAEDQREPLESMNKSRP